MLLLMPAHALHISLPNFFLHNHSSLSFQEYFARDGDIYTAGCRRVPVGQYTVNPWFLPRLCHLLVVLCHCWMPVFTS